MNPLIIQILEYLGIAGGTIAGMKLVDFLLIKYKLKEAKTTSSSQEFQSYDETTQLFMDRLAKTTESARKSMELANQYKLKNYTSSSFNRALQDLIRRHVVTCKNESSELVDELEQIIKTFGNEE